MKKIIIYYSRKLGYVKSGWDIGTDRWDALAALECARMQLHDQIKKEQKETCKKVKK